VEVCEVFSAADEQFISVQQNLKGSGISRIYPIIYVLFYWKMMSVELIRLSNGTN
jgi:hypothetical protein